MFRISIFISIFFAIVGCEPDYPAPEGYVESCYGGDFEKKLAGSKPELLVMLELEVKHWGTLRGQLEELAKESNVRFFFDDREYNGLKIFNASLCSEGGLFMNVDKRIWSNSDVSNLPMVLTIYTYENQSTWGSFIEKVKISMEKNWKEYYVKNEAEVSLELSN